MIEDLENLSQKRIKYDPEEEYGRIGQKKYNGVFFEEFEPRLKGGKAIEVYKEMATNDSIIGGLLFAIEMLIKQATFFVEAGGNTAADQKAKQFVEECFEDLSPGWNDTLSDILSFLTYGWDIHEICYKRRLGSKEDPCDSSRYNDGLIGWSKFAVRAQDTLYEWLYNDHDDLIGFSQLIATEGKVRIIPIEKCLHFKNRSQRENPEGQSILRNAYTSYYFKSRIQVIEGIGIERDLAGLPIIKPGPNTDIFGDTELATQRRTFAQNMISSLRRDELEGIVLPNDWELSLLSSGGGRQFDINSVIERYNKAIAGTVLADFITLGHDGVGSYALSQSKTSIFYMAITSYLDHITEVINTQAIPALINLNSSAFPVLTDYPKFRHTDIGDRDLSGLADYVSRLISCTALTPDDGLERYLRKEGDLPLMPSLDDFSSTNVRPKEGEL